MPSGKAWDSWFRSDCDWPSIHKQTKIHIRLKRRSCSWGMASGVSPVLMEPLGSRRRSAPSPPSGRARGGASLRTATHASLPSRSTRTNLAGPLVWPTAGLPWQEDAMHQTHEFGFSAPSPGCEEVRRRRRHLSYLQRAWPGRVHRSSSTRKG